MVTQGLAMPEHPGNETRICCAYDGSVNAHWVARYAIHLAASTAARTLRFIHVRDRHISNGLLARKLEHVLGDCERAGIEATVHDVQAQRGVSESVLEALPGGPDALLLCGTRARARRQRLLAGTVSESLLRAARCSVLALRVVLPGLLGAPRRVLMPVAGNPGEARAAVPVLRLLLPTLEELHLLRVVPTADTQARIASRETLESLRAQGRASVTHVENELRGAMALADTHLDAYVRIAKEWVGPSIVAAGQHGCGLILAGASQRLLGGTAAEMRRMERLLAHAPCDVGILRSAP
jgi:nucleotide-binding universal stress UspA family protein